MQFFQLFIMTKTYGGLNTWPVGLFCMAKQPFLMKVASWDFHRKRQFLTILILVERPFQLGLSSTINRLSLSLFLSLFLACTFQTIQKWSLDHFYNGLNNCTSDLTRKWSLDHFLMVYLFAYLTYYLALCQKWSLDHFQWSKWLLTYSLGLKQSLNHF